MYPRLPRWWWLPLALAVGAVSLPWLPSRATAQEGITLPPLVAKTLPPPGLSREALVSWALENNPEIAAIRQQRGIAAAGVVIARTYPFNPFWEAKIEGASGPESAGITNEVINEHKILLEVELHGQRGHRERAAAAALKRTEWEIVFQEVTLISRVLRFYDGVLYRQAKVQVAQDRLDLSERAAKQIQKLLEAGKLGPADLLLIKTEVDNSRALRGSAELALVTALTDLQRATGNVGEPFVLAGKLQAPPLPADLDRLFDIALEARPDLRARQLAVAEAAARVDLEVSNRYGNPILGPSFTYDATRVASVGVQMSIPLPVLNTKRGEIQQRQAEQARAVLDLRQTEVAVQQDVQAALARLHRSAVLVETFEKQVLPNLTKSLEAMQKLFQAQVGGVDVLRIIDVGRSLINARDSYYDALWEWSQAWADLVGAVGDPTVFLGPEAFPAAGPCGCLPTSTNPH
jgi:cobalt-zinc-cadmium efflux system outer membrane protein